MPLEHLPANAAPADIQAILERDGCVVIDNILSEELVDTILAEMSSHREERSLGSDDFDGFHTRRTGPFANKSSCY